MKETVKRKMHYLIAIVMLLCGTAGAASPSELLQQGLYAEEIEGDLPAAIAEYEQVINDAAASEKLVAQALYRQGLCYVRLKQDDKAVGVLTRLVDQHAGQTDLIEKAQPVLESIQVFDPASLMPPETLAYLELGSTGKQIETILEMLKGTPLEDPLAAISQNNTGGMNSGPEVLMAGVLNPAMQAEFKKIRGLAVGVLDVGPQGTSLMAVLHLGDSAMLRGLLMTGLTMAARPGPPVEGMQTYSIERQIEIACDDKVFIVAISAGNSRLAWMIRQYKHLTSDSSLASDPSFRKIDKAVRQKNLATLWVNTDDLYTRIAQQMPQDRPTEFQIAAGVINITTIEDLMLTASLAADVIGLDGRIQFKEGMPNMAYEMIKTPAIDRKGLDGVPGDAFALLSFDLAGSDSLQAAQLRMLAMNTLGLDLSADLIDSIQQITLFALPCTNDLSDIPLRPGLVIHCRDQAPVIPFMQSIEMMLNQLAIESQVANGTVVLAFEKDVIDAVNEKLAEAPSVTEAGLLNAKVKKYADSAEKLALVSIGGFVRCYAADTAAYNVPSVPDEVNRKIVAAYESLAQVVEGATLSVRTEERSSDLVIQARLSGIPPLSELLPSIRDIDLADSEAQSYIREAGVSRMRQQQAATICRADAAPAIDGELDAMWKAARIYPLDHTLYASSKPTNRLAADYRMLWDATNLYVFVDVTDSTPQYNPELEWQFNDSIELYIDARNAKSSDYTESDYAFGFGMDDQGPRLVEAHEKPIVEFVDYNLKMTATGYCLEAAFPLEQLGVNPSAGSKMGVEVQVNDNQSGAKRDAKISRYDGSDSAWLHPSSFGTAELAGLVGYWPCDEMEGAAVEDESGRGQDGTLQGNIQWVKGRVGGAIDLDGRSSYVLIPDESAFDLTGEITIACWVNIRSVTSDWMPFITKGNTSWRLSTGPDRAASYHLGLNNQPDGARVTTAWPGVLGEWHHVTAAYGANTMQIYVDGKLWATEFYAGYITPNDSPVMIGANAEAMDRWFDGLIDEVRVYNRALSPDEIKKLASAGLEQNALPENKKQAKRGEVTAADKMVDLKPFSQSPFKASEKYAGMTDQPVFDGLPFDLACSLELYGTQNADRGNNLPRKITGIPVGVAFDELHLLHCAAWEEVQDCPVAILRLHYEGGGSQDFEIKYGVHLSDWNRLPSEAEEVLTDPDSKIVWRGEGVYGGTGRLFKTVLRNPHPERVVKSMDLFSAGTRVSYQLLAATVAKSGPQRAVTPGLPLNQPAFHFDGALKVIALDARTGKPIPGADVYWHGEIAGQGIVAPPQLTGTNGVTVIKYPLAGTEAFDIQVAKPGYNMSWGNWIRLNKTSEMTFRLEPLAGP